MRIDILLLHLEEAEKRYHILDSTEPCEAVSIASGLITFSKSLNQNTVSDDNDDDNDYDNMWNRTESCSFS